jgi:hypothetical protein
MLYRTAIIFVLSLTTVNAMFKTPKGKAVAQSPATPPVVIVPKQKQEWNTIEMSPWQVESNLKKEHDTNKRMQELAENFADKRYKG